MTIVAIKSKIIKLSKKFQELLENKHFDLIKQFIKKFPILSNSGNWTFCLNVINDYAYKYNTIYTSYKHKPQKYLKTKSFNDKYFLKNLIFKLSFILTIIISFSMKNKF